MDADDNAGQRAFWNGPQGQSWVANQAALDALHTGGTELLLTEAAARPGARLLDIGCGAGATTLAFARAVGPAGSVTGVDISEPLLGLARARAEAEDVANATFLHADAAHHRFDPGSVDQVVSRFGLMFFANPPAALATIGAALRPGGAIVFVTWAGLAENPWFALPLAAAVARLGPPEPGDPDAPGPMAFRDIGRITGILGAAGFAEAEGEVHAVDLHLPGGLDAACALALRIGAASRLIRDKGGDEGDAAAIAADLRVRLAPFVSVDGIRVPAAVNVFRARRF